MFCKNCGSKMIGDGFTEVVRCEFAEVPVDTPVDGGPVFCPADKDKDEDEEDRYLVLWKARYGMR